MVSGHGVAVVGSINTDMVVRVPLLPAPGETIVGGDLVIAGGGKGANQAVAVSRLGGQVRLIGCIGSDALGDETLARLIADGVDCAAVRRSERASGDALIFVDARGENVIAVAPGANGDVTSELAVAALEAGEPPAVLLLQLEIPVETAASVMRWGHERGVAVVLNPAPARRLDPDLLSLASVITPNEPEAALLTGQPVRDLATAATAARWLHARTGSAVVVTVGGDGAVVAAVDGRVDHVAPWLVDVVDTTGAGDVFSGALALALARGDDLPAAVEFANLAAAVSVTRIGAQPSMATRAEVDRLRAAGRRGQRLDVGEQ